ncbi:MAG: hypothetical protein U0Y10_04515 [Spirosomataceae bacterium]
MEKTIILIAVVLGLLIGGGYLLIDANPEVKAQAIKLGIVEAPEAPPVQPSHNATFIIFDPSGSGTSAYAVPKISVAYIISVIDSIKNHGTGDIWLTYIDKNANNNAVLHFEITNATGSLKRPVRESGERKGTFDKRVAAFQADSTKAAANAHTLAQVFEAKKKQFLADCQVMIDAGYAPKKRGEDYSDCIGSINAGLRSLRTVQHDSTHFRSILFISDGVQSSPRGMAPDKLSAIPDDVKIVTINHSGSKNNVVEGRTIEVDNLDRGLAKAIQKTN